MTKVKAFRGVDWDSEDNFLHAQDHLNDNNDKSVSVYIATDCIVNVITMSNQFRSLFSK